MAGAFKKPKVEDPEELPEPVDEDSAALGSARVAALREGRRRGGMMSTLMRGTAGLTGRPPTRQGSLMGKY